MPPQPGGPPDGMRCFSFRGLLFFLVLLWRRLPRGLRVNGFCRPFQSGVYNLPLPILPLTYLARMVCIVLALKTHGSHGRIVGLLGHYILDLRVVESPCFFDSLSKK